MGMNYSATRDYPAAAKIFDRAALIAPDVYSARL